MRSRVQNRCIASADSIQAPGAAPGALDQPQPSESYFSARAVLRFARQGYILFRNNVGVYLTPDGSRKVRCGLAPGSSDRIGWRSIEITAEHIGTRLAVFVGVEVKKPGGRLSPKQRNFLNAVHNAGGEAWVTTGDQDERWNGGGK